jgi:hypothetical protein
MIIGKCMLGMLAICALAIHCGDKLTAGFCLGAAPIMCLLDNMWAHQQRQIRMYRAMLTELTDAILAHAESRVEKQFAEGEETIQ